MSAEFRRKQKLIGLWEWNRSISLSLERGFWVLNLFLWVYTSFFILPGEDQLWVKIWTKNLNPNTSKRRKLDIQLEEHFEPSLNLVRAKGGKLVGAHLIFRWHSLIVRNSIILHFKSSLYFFWSPSPHKKKEKEKDKHIYIYVSVFRLLYTCCFVVLFFFFSPC